MSDIETFMAKPSNKIKGWKSWFGLYGIDKKTNELYILPESIGYSPTEAIMCLSYDGTNIVRVKHNNKEYILIPYSWAEKEVSKNTELTIGIKKLKENILSSHKKCYSGNVNNNKE